MNAERRILAVVVGLLTLPMPWPLAAQAIDIAGAKYETQMLLDGQRLQLNGAGIRYKAIFKVYAAGPYPCC
jgi:hypothetical protein